MDREKFARRSKGFLLLQDEPLEVRSAELSLAILQTLEEIRDSLQQEERFDAIDEMKSAVIKSHFDSMDKALSEKKSGECGCSSSGPCPAHTDVSIPD